MSDQPDNQPLPPHWNVDWTEDSTRRTILPWWIILLWSFFLLWGVIYIVDSAANW